MHVELKLMLLMLWELINETSLKKIAIILLVTKANL